MVSVSSLEVVFCKSDVCFSGVVVLTCDGGLVDYGDDCRQFPLSGNVFFCRQLQVLVSFGVSCGVFAVVIYVILPPSGDK